MDIKAVASRLYQVFDGDKDVSVLDEFVSVDYVDHMPLPGTAVGREGLKQTVQIFRSGMPDMKTIIATMIDDGLWSSHAAWLWERTVAIFSVFLPQESTWNLPLWICTISSMAN